ncbi:MAG: M48 family peptidase, partial [Nitrospirota bacterium]
MIGRREALARALWLAKGICGLSLTGGLMEALSGCTRASVTGRDQFILPNYTEEKERELGIEAYRDVLRHFPLSTDPEINAMIRRVGERIAEAANKPSFDWEFAVIKD